MGKCQILYSNDNKGTTDSQHVGSHKQVSKKGIYKRIHPVGLHLYMFKNRQNPQQAKNSCGFRGHSWGIMTENGQEGISGVLIMFYLFFVCMLISL